jgi:hypothetical protein
MNFTTQQKGYGRQGLYFDFNGDTYYLCDVYPNIKEHFNGFCLNEDCFFNEETEVYTNSNGSEVTPIDNWDEFLFSHYKTEIGEILFEELDHEEYSIDFDNLTYEEIAEWANNY